MSKISWEIAMDKGRGSRWPRRVFLTQEEREFIAVWGVPIRYIPRDQRTRLGNRCTFPGCNRRDTQVAHRIPFNIGITVYGLTPTYLMRVKNLTPRCRAHNKYAEWSGAKIRAHVERLRECGVNP